MGFLAGGSSSKTYALSGALSVWLLAGLALGAASMAHAAANTSATSIAGTSEQANAKAAPVDLASLAEFVEVFDTIKSNHPSNFTDQQLFEFAITGMLSKLDPYSGVIQSDTYVTDIQAIVNNDNQAALYKPNLYLQRQDNGQWCAIAGLTVIDSASAQVPQQVSGLELGECVLQVDKRPISTLSADQVNQLLLGEMNSKVLLSLSNAQGAKRTLSMLRTQPEVLQATAQLLADKSLYIHIPAFYPNLAQEVQQHIAAYQAKQKYESNNGVVIDLRGNAGGLITAAADVAGLFVSNNIVFSNQLFKSAPKAGSADKTGLAAATVPIYTNAYNGNFPSLTMVILVDHSTASAAEVFSAFMQDYRRAIVIGEVTRGKASIQKVYSLHNGKSYTLTVGAYTRPSMGRIQDVGVTPDVRLEAKTKGPINMTVMPSKTSLIMQQDVWLQQALKVLHNSPLKVQTGRSNNE